MDNPFFVAFALIFVLVCFIIRWRFDNKYFGGQSVKTKGKVIFFTPTKAKTYITISLLVIFFMLFGTDISWLGECPLDSATCSDYRLGSIIAIGYSVFLHPIKLLIIITAFLAAYFLSCVIVALIRNLRKQQKAYAGRPKR